MTRAQREALRAVATPEAPEELLLRLWKGLEEAGLLPHLWGIATLEGVTLADILSRSRMKSIVRARHACFWMIREGYGKSSTEVGKLFGVDHTTVLDGIRSHERRLEDERARTREEAADAYA